ncbi:MAG: DUF4397 domain-containing protein [Candidatus Viridilinea halotolerans]|uniref:DUF4397 domain-containing protein n=1 Tax=Candidatus Viridilinea halotolerans TaxID=2491704 RepID=A0A426TV31_9CHLR|nr:MAG: DUF4397 domain-containing protein [Candidatus Viridilinea halotolerans]
MLLGGCEETRFPCAPLLYLLVTYNSLREGGLIVNKKYVESPSGHFNISCTVERRNALSKQSQGILRFVFALSVFTLFVLGIGSSFANDAQPQTLTLVDTETVKLRIYDMQFSEETNFTGKLALTIPQNELPGVEISGTYDGASDSLAVNLPHLPALRVAGASLELTTVSISRNGLSAEAATLKLPEKLGNVEAALTQVTIDTNGLRIGEGSASFALPDIRIGGSSGFTLTGGQGSLEIASHQSYKLNIAGSVAVNLPSNSVSVTGNLWFDSEGRIGGKLEAFALNVAGFTFAISDIELRDDGSLAVGRAAINAPAQWRGGPGADVSNLVISPQAPFITFSSAKVVLPTIKAGNFTLGGIIAEIATENGGFSLRGAGTFSLPSVGAPGCSGFGVAVHIFLQPGTGNPVMALDELDPAQRQQYQIDHATYSPDIAAMPNPMVRADAYRDAVAGDTVLLPSALPNIALREASLSVSCNIPIPKTPFFITGVRGTVVLTSDVVSIKVGLEISAGTKIAGVSIISASGDVTLAAKPLSMGIEGTVKVFNFSAASAGASIGLDGFRGTLNLDLVVARGNLNVRAWADHRGEHLTGTGIMEVGIPKGKIFSKGWWRLAINLPPHDIRLGSVGIEAGKFRNGQWGFKGTAEMSLGPIRHRKGFFINTSGNLSFTNVDSYQLVTPLVVQAAQAEFELASTQGIQLSEVTVGSQRISFASDGEVLLAAPIAHQADATFLFARIGNAPTFSLIRPDGTRIEATTQLENVFYDEDIAYTGPIYPGIEQDAPDERPFLRFMQALPGSASLELTLEQQAREVFSNVDLTRASNYAPQSAGTYQATVRQQDGTMLQLANVTLANDQDYTLVTALVPPQRTYLPIVATSGTRGNPQAASSAPVAPALAPSPRLLVLLDDNTPPAYGEARLRLVNLFSDLERISLVATAGPSATTLLQDLTFAQANGYAGLAPGTYTFALQAAGQTVHTMANVEIVAGNTYSIFALGDATQRRATLQLDTESLVEVDVIYYVDDAEVGDWKMAVCCNVTNDRYIATYVTDIPAPELSEVAVELLDGQKARVSWQVTAADADTIVSIYANDEAPNLTIASGENIPAYYGEELAAELPTAVDGSRQQVEVDLSQLESGTYHIYVEVEDTRNEPIQRYAPAPITVDQTASWPISWQANATFSQTLTLDSPGIDLEWAPLNHPDVDEYRVYWGMAADQLSEEEFVGDATFLELDAFDYGDTVFFQIGAFYSTAQRDVRSQTISFTVPVAVYTITPAQAALTLPAGQSATLNLTLQTALSVYPDMVYLDTGDALPDGIYVDFASDLVLPTTAGAQVAMTISSANSLPPGVYTIPIVAEGGGLTRNFAIQLTVGAP